MTSNNINEQGLRGTAGAVMRLVAALAIAAGASFASGAIAAEQAAGAKADPAAGGKIAQGVCAACHGTDGNSQLPDNPKIAGQFPEYLAKQLHEFKPDGDKPAARQNAIMAGFAASLSDDDIRNVAAYFGAQELKPATATNRETAELAQSIYRGGIAEKGVPACGGCHGPTGAGIPSQYPRISGQFAKYTKAQLEAFRSGARANNQPMTDIASRLSDAEIDALADYVAGLR